METKSIFKNRNFNLLVIGQIISLFGSAIQRFAISLYVLNTTNSGMIFATVVSASLIPNIILGPISGVIADRYNRRNIMITLDVISTIIVGAMILLNNSGNLSLVVIYASVILFSTITLFYQPAVNAAIPLMVSEDQLLHANSINSIIFTFSSLLGPILGGILYGMLGIKLILILNAVSFLFAVIIETFMKIPHTQRKESSNFVKSVVRDLKEGINYVFDSKLLKKLMLVSLLANIFVYPYFTVGVAFITKIILGASDKQYGLCEGIILFGGLIGPMIIGVINKKLELSKIFILAIAFSGIGLLTIAGITTPNFIGMFSTNLVPLIIITVMSLLIMVVLTLLNVSVLTMVQKEAPKELTGRIISALMTLSIAAVPVGQLAFGMVFDRFEANSYIGILVSAIVLILLAVYIKKSNIEKENTIKSTGNIEG